MDAFVPFAAIAASALFILSLMWMSHPSTARRGVRAGEIGMVIAIIGALVQHEVVDYNLIIIAMIGNTCMFSAVGRISRSVIVPIPKPKMHANKAQYRSLFKRRPTRQAVAIPTRRRTISTPERMTPQSRKKLMIALCA